MPSRARHRLGRILLNPNKDAEAAPPLTREEKRACQAAGVGGGPRCHVRKHGPRCPRPPGAAGPSSHNPWVHPLPPLQGAAKEGKVHKRNASSHNTKPDSPCCTRRKSELGRSETGSSKRKDVYSRRKHGVLHPAQNAAGQGGTKSQRELETAARFEGGE